MELVLFSDKPPPSRKSWGSDSRNDRDEWGSIAEMITTWFCYSNGIRKKLNLSVVVGDTSIKLIGDKLRYLAPSLRSALSILYNAYNAFIEDKPKKRQPGVFVTTISDLSHFEYPRYSLRLSDILTHTLSKNINVYGPGTLFSKKSIDATLQISIPAKHHAQALNWLIYGWK